MALNPYSPQGPADVVNRSTALIGGFNNASPVTGTPPSFDGSDIGIAAGALYGGAVQTVGKQFGWDFARNVAFLVVSGNAPPWGWLFEYLYPTNGIEIRQLLNSVATQLTLDPNDPIPLLWEIGYNSVGGTPVKVIWCNIQNAVARISGQPPENTWDALFTEAVVRLLASELAMAIEARPDTGNLEIQRATEFTQLGEQRDG